MLSIKYMFAFAIIATLASSAFAIRCYTCDSTINAKCGEEFKAEESMKIDCSRMNAPLYILSTLTGRNLNATGCMKQTLESVVGHPHIFRTCYFGDINNVQSGCRVDPTQVFQKQLSCDVCTGEYCNSSSSMAPIAAAIIGFFALARIFS